MDYDVKKSLISELSKSMSGTGVEEEKTGQITAKYDQATNSLSFGLSGTNYNVKDMSEARKFFSVNGKTMENPEKKIFYEIASLCIDSILKEFTEVK